VLIVVDANRSLSSNAADMENFLLDGLSKLSIPATLVFNKVKSYIWTMTFSLLFMCNRLLDGSDWPRGLCVKTSC
jgi:hypothetical protein